MLRRFKRHLLGMFSAVILLFLGIFTIFAEFFAPYTNDALVGPTHAPPQRIHFFDTQGKFHVRPFIYPVEKTFDFNTGIVTFTVWVIPVARPE